VGCSDIQSYPPETARPHLTFSDQAPRRNYASDGRAEALWRQAVTYSGFGILGAVAWTLLALRGPDVQTVIFPVATVSWLFAVFATILYFQNGQVPIFHVGFFAAATALVYIALPAFFFAVSGFEWSPTSDFRLQRLGVGPNGVSNYVWRGAIYLSAFCVTYLLMVRGLPKPPRTTAVPVTGFDVATCVALIAACLLYQTAISFAFGIPISEKDAAFPADALNPNLPLLVAQLTHNIMAIQRIAKLALVVALVGLSKNKWAIVALIAFLGIELLSTLSLFGPRTYYATLLLATLLAFHKFIRPISLPLLVTFAVGFLGLLLGYGNLRNNSDSLVDFSMANEFQVLMATALDVRQMVESGLKVPTEVLWSEILMLIPQQFLPVNKIDPSIWYLIESGYSESGSGYMFGLQSQAAVGWGNPELLVRGVLLAVLLGWVHRHYSKHMTSFIVTVSYIWLLTTIYYSYRASTFYWITFVVFRLLVFVGIFLGLRRLLRMNTAFWKS
jgi:hypothetical protein